MRAIEVLKNLGRKQGADSNAATVQKERFEQALSNTTFDDIERGRELAKQIKQHTANVELKTPVAVFLVEAGDGISLSAVVPGKSASGDQPMDEETVRRQTAALVHVLDREFHFEVRIDDSCFRAGYQAGGTNKLIVIQHMPDLANAGMCWDGQRDEIELFDEKPVD